MQARLIADAVAAERASLLIVAPHPDDESLATGGLIQVALAHGARVSVIVLTDGENNAWPQRAVERRLRVTADDRARWGARRRDEARRALGILGVPDASVRFFGLPDLGLTDRLVLAPSDSIAGLRAMLDRVRPTVIVAPGIGDRHPDHSAAHVMVRMALAGSGSSTRVLSYVVHGASASDGVECAVENGMRQRKLDAVAAHASQLILSRRRMLRYARRAERFRLEKPEASQSSGTELRLPWRISRSTASLTELTVVGQFRAWMIPVHGDSKRRRDDSPNCVRRDDGSLWLHFPSQLAGNAPVFARLSARIQSPWIYDRWGWTSLAASDGP